METHEKILAALTIISSTIGIAASVLYLRERYYNQQAARLAARFPKTEIERQTTHQQLYPGTETPPRGTARWYSQPPLAPMDITETKVT